MRVYNRDPYMVESDNPIGGSMKLGGAIFYTGTDAPDDDQPGSCAAGLWRHSYWVISSGSVGLTGSIGCFDVDLWCRERR